MKVDSLISRIPGALLALLFLIGAFGLALTQEFEQPETGRVEGEGEKPPRARRQSLEFHGGVVLGDPVPEDCTLRCHIDYPFEKGKRFSHETHAPKAGFACDICHDPVHLPSEDHGKLWLGMGGCIECHHDSERFPDCEACHKPVKRVLHFMGLTFDHEKHAYSDYSPACQNCHSQLLIPRSRRTMIECTTCHHVRGSQPADCKVCHENAVLPRLSEVFEGFDHGLHAGSKWIEEECWACHFKQPLAPPTELSCDGCHHPDKTDKNFACVICHVEVYQERSPRARTHLKAAFACKACHSMDPKRHPAAGLDCGRCHHLMESRCRTCHDEKLYFVKWFEGIPASTGRMRFIHAEHEGDDNCLTCHVRGPDIRRGFETLNCADCHHHGGHGPGCIHCHGEIERIRSGILPSGRRGEPEVMYDIVACEDCHVFDPASPKSITDGSASCSRCHPQDYMAWFDDIRNVLIREYRANRSDMDPDEMTKTLRHGVHHIPLLLEDLRNPPMEEESSP
ncbi:MAG: cytochrome c3 family protein [Planctomycetota bacterium]|jgi:hypothetical protein